LSQNAFFLLLTPFAFRNAQWLRPLAYFYAGVHLLNGTGHTLATIFGQTVSSFTFRARHRALSRLCSSQDPSISWFD